MRGIVPDVNIEGLVLSMTARIRRSALADIWETLDLTVHTFATLGWPGVLPDREVWRRCQSARLVLVTDNRNQDDPDSLEATLRDSVRPDSLPVVTVSDKDRFRTDRKYADRVTTALFELLFDVRHFEMYYGAGRVFIPGNRTTRGSRS